MSDFDPALWRRLLDDHNRAHDELERAERLLETALSTPEEIGAPLARRRVARAAKRAARVTFTLTGGRPLNEVLWSAPDEL